MLSSLLVASVLSQSPSALPEPVPFHWTPGVSAKVYDFKGDGTLIEITPTIVLPKVLKDVSITLTLPIWSQNADSVTTSGMSDIGINAETSLWNSNLFGGKFEWTGDVGILIPLASNSGFASTSVTPIFGTTATLQWGKLSFAQDIDWTLITNGSSWNALLNSQVDAEWLNGKTALRYQFADSLSAGVAFDEQWVTTGEWTVLVGPEAKWSPFTNWELSAGIGFPVYQNTGTYDEVNTVVQCGLSVGF